MKNVPKMVYDLIEQEDLVCSACSHVSFKKKDLFLVGIMPSVNSKDHRDVLTIGFFCKKCQELTLFEIKDMTLVELASIIKKKNEKD